MTALAPSPVDALDARVAQGAPKPSQPVMGDENMVEEGDPMQRTLGEIIRWIRVKAHWRQWAVDRNTFLNEAFDKDAQYVEFDPARRQVIAVPAPRNSVRRTVNMFAPFNRTMQSSLTAGMPTYQVQADRMDEHSEDTAQLGNDLIPWVEKLIRMEDLRSKNGFWLPRSGNTVVFNLWDLSPGPNALVSLYGLEQGLPYSEVHPPHEVFYYPFTATEPYHAVLIGREVRMSRAEAIDMLPNLADDLWGNPQADAVWGSNITRAIRDFPPGMQGWLQQEGVMFNLPGAPISLDDRDEVVLWEVFIRKGGVLLNEGVAEGSRGSASGSGREVLRFPEGARIIMSPNGKIGWFGKNLYSTPRHPIPAVRFRYSQSAGFWGPAPDTPLRPLQMAINWAVSLFEENMIMAGRPILLWPKEARAAWRRLADLTAKILQYRSGPKGQEPKYMTPPNFPTTLPELITLYLQLWQDISSRHEVSKGQIPGSGISGVAIDLLQQQDNTSMGFAIREREVGEAAVVEQHLENIRRFCPEETLATLAGNSEHQARVFRGSDLGTGVRVSVVPGSAMPKSAAATEAKAREAWLSGVLLDEYGQPDPKRLLVIMGLGSEERLYAEDQQDKNNAGMEEDLLLGLPVVLADMALTFYEKMGVMPSDFMPKPFDNHIVHEGRHRRRLKELREEIASGKSQYTPIHLELLQAHWQMTIPLMVQQKMGMPPMPGFGSAAGVIAPQLAGAGGGPGAPNAPPAPPAAGAPPAGGKPKAAAAA